MANSKMENTSLSNQITVPVQEQNFGSELDCGSRSTPVPASSTHREVQCLFCTNYIPSSDKVQHMLNSQKLAEILKIVSGHLVQKNTKLPQNLDPEVVRLCASCLEIVLEIYEDHKIMLEVRQNITSSVSKLEEVMINAWLINQGRTPEKNEWTGLIDMAIEVYRNKLIMKKQLRKAIALEGQNQVSLEPEFCSHTILLRDEIIRQQFKKARNNENAKTPTIKTEKNDDETMKNSSSTITVEVNPMDIHYGSLRPNHHPIASESTVETDEILKEADNINSVIMDLVSGGEAANTPFYPETTTVATTATHSSSPPKRKLNSKSQTTSEQGTPAYPNPTTDYQRRCKIYICDICERPIRGNSTKLMAHKFSHKNDDERREAVAAGEPGCTLSLRSNLGFQRKKGHAASKLKCQICSRQFLTADDFQNHLGEHCHGN